jgi:hypothetical protein
MASNIDVTKPTAVSPTTASVRANFVTIKSEIEALQAISNVANTALTYNTDGTVATITSDGVVYTLVYTNGNITSMTYGAKTTTIGYDSSNRVNSVITV